MNSTNAFSYSLILIQYTNLKFAASVRGHLWSPICCLFYLSTTVQTAISPALNWFTATRQLSWCLLTLTQKQLWFSKYRNIMFACKTNRRASVEISPSRFPGRSPSRCDWSAAPPWSSPTTAAHHRSPGASWETAAYSLFRAHSPLVYSNLRIEGDGVTLLRMAEKMGSTAEQSRFPLLLNTNYSDMKS